MLNLEKGVSKGFTLIELLIVLIVVGVLAGIIMVASNMAINRAKINADISIVKSLNTATVIYKTIKTLYSNSDVFVGFNDDEVRLKELLDSGEISAIPIPNVKGNSFAWNIASQKWVISGDITPPGPSGHVVTASEITMGTGGHAGVIKEPYTGDPSYKNIIIPNNINGTPVIAIYQDVFKNKGLTSVVIENGITHIHARAFMNNNLIEIVLPNSITRIDYGAFLGNNLTKITIGGGVTVIEGAAFANNASFVAAYTLGGAGTYNLIVNNWVKQ